MADSASNLILYPAFAMYLLVVLVFLRLRSMRFAAVRRNDVPVDFYKTFTDYEEPDELRVVTRNFINLFEVPVLFYVVTIMIYVTHQSTYWLVALAWFFVALRYAHTYVHLTSNDVIMRFTFYAAGNLVLTILWAILLVQLVRAG